MRRLLFLPVLVLLVSSRPSPVAAQTGPQPNLVLTLFGGAVSGHFLWGIDRQPLCVLQGSGGVFSCTSLYDTLTLSRKVSASIVAGASGSYFKSAHVGVQGEIYYLGFSLDDTCTGVFYNPDAENRNQQVCNDITAASLSTSAIALFGNVIVRASPRHAISPYVTAGGGVVSHSGGTVEMSGRFASSGGVNSRAVIQDDHPNRTSVSAQLAAGLTTRLSPGYQFRFELRDVMAPLRHVTGRADVNTLVPPTASRTFHHVALTLGLDIVLERKRGQRY